MKQCKACPWRKDVVPDRDIPNGYCAQKHADLKGTIADLGAWDAGALRIMACHESPVRRERACVGWLSNQLGPGNNIRLRFARLTRPEWTSLELVGEQHETFEETLHGG